MSNTAIVQARISPAIKQKAELILNKLGMTPGDAIRIMYHQVIAQHGYPISLHMPHEPNAKTAATMRKAQRGEDLHTAGDADAFFDSFKK